MSRPFPDLEQYVQQKIASGQFSSREDFACEAFRVYRELETRHESLKRDVQVALEQSEKGQSEPLDMDSIRRELTDELDERGRGN